MASTSSVLDPIDETASFVGFHQLDYAQASTFLFDCDTPTPLDCLSSDDSLSFLHHSLTLPPSPPVCNPLHWDGTEISTDTSLTSGPRCVSADPREWEKHVFTAHESIQAVTPPASPHRLFSWPNSSVRSSMVDRMYRPFDYPFPFQVIGQCIMCGSHRPPCNLCFSTHCPHAERTCLTCVGDVVYRLERDRPLSRPPVLPTKFQSGLAEIVQAFIPDWECNLRHPVPDRILHRCPLLVVLGFTVFTQSYQQLWAILRRHLIQREEHGLRAQLGAGTDLLRSLWSLLAALVTQMQQLMQSSHGSRLSRIVTARTRWGCPSLFSPPDWKRVAGLLDRTGASFERFSEALEDELNEVYPMHRLLNRAILQIQHDGKLASSATDHPTTAQAQLEHFVLHRSEEIARALRYCVQRQMVCTMASVYHSMLVLSRMNATGLAEQQQQHLPTEPQPIDCASTFCARPGAASFSLDDLSQSLTRVRRLVSNLRQGQTRQPSPFMTPLGLIGVEDIERLMEGQSSFHVGSPFRYAGPQGCETTDPPVLIAQLLSFGQHSKRAIPHAGTTNSDERRSHGCTTLPGNISSAQRPSHLSHMQAVADSTGRSGQQCRTIRVSSTHELVSVTGAEQSTLLSAPIARHNPQHDAVSSVSSLRRQCMLYIVVLGCLRFLPDTATRSQRGSRALCMQCQAIFCGPRAQQTGCPSFFWPIEIDSDRLLLVSLQLNSPRSPRGTTSATMTTTPPADLPRKKRRLHDSSTDDTKHRHDSLSGWHGEQETKVDDQGRLTNRDRSITMRTAGISTVVAVKRLTVHIDGLLEAYLYVFMSPIDLSMAAAHWLGHSSTLRRVQLRCYAVNRAIRLKYCNSGEAIRIDPTALRQLIVGDSSLVTLMVQEGSPNTRGLVADDRKD